MCTCSINYYSNIFWCTDLCVVNMSSQLPHIRVQTDTQFDRLLCADFNKVKLCTIQKAMANYLTYKCLEKKGHAIGLDILINTVLDMLMIPISLICEHPVLRATLVDHSCVSETGDGTRQALFQLVTSVEIKKLQPSILEFLITENGSQIRWSFTVIRDSM